MNSQLSQDYSKLNLKINTNPKPNSKTNTKRSPNTN